MWEYVWASEWDPGINDKRIDVKLQHKGESSVAINKQLVQI